MSEPGNDRRHVKKTLFSSSHHRDICLAWAPNCMLCIPGVFIGAAVLLFQGEYEACRSWESCLLVTDRA
jgi:hypothetical protein